MAGVPDPSGAVARRLYQAGINSTYKSRGSAQVAHRQAGHCDSNLSC